MEQKTKAGKVTSKKTTKEIKTKKVTKKSKPSFEQIQARAYQIYVENGFKGNEMENWLKAEKELK